MMELQNNMRAMRQHRMGVRAPQQPLVGWQQQLASRCLELAFDLLINSLALPTPDRRVGEAQQLILLISAEARLAVSGTSGVLEESPEFAPCSPGSSCGAVVLRNSNRVRRLRANCYRLYRRWTERHRNRLRINPSTHGADRH